jgi:hypothetical protein
MPTYKFLNTETNEEFEDFISIARKDELLKMNPHIQQMVSAPAIISGSSSSNKVPDGFKEVLSKVAEAHPESPLAEKHGRKSIKEIRTKEIVEKHYKKWKKT